ncbi:MAG: 30S ribosomal protein S6 [Nitrospiria bacterium]
MKVETEDKPDMIAETNQENDLNQNDCYETLFILKQSLSEEEVTAVIEKVKAVIEREEGKVAGFTNWGKKKLAYEVQKERKGIYIALHYQGTGKTNIELERHFRFTESIIRDIILKIDSEMLGKTEPVQEERTFAPRGRSGGKGWR